MDTDKLLQQLEKMYNRKMTEGEQKMNLPIKWGEQINF